MRMRLALGLLVLLLLPGCLPAGSSVWAVDAGHGPPGPVYGPHPYPGYAVPYGYYPFSRFEPSPFYGARPVFPYHHPRRCGRDRFGRVWC